VHHLQQRRAVQARGGERDSRRDVAVQVAFEEQILLKQFITS
jgi:hypothetical protein